MTSLSLLAPPAFDLASVAVSLRLYGLEVRTSELTIKGTGSTSKVDKVVLIHPETGIGQLAEALAVLTVSSSTAYSDESDHPFRAKRPVRLKEPLAVPPRF